MIINVKIGSNTSAMDQINERNQTDLSSIFNNHTGLIGSRLFEQSSKPNTPYSIYSIKGYIVLSIF